LTRAVDSEDKTGFQKTPPPPYLPRLEIKVELSRKKFESSIPIPPKIIFLMN